MGGIIIVVINRFVRKIESLEMHHRIFAFFVISVGSVVLTRLFVLFHDPNPVFFDFEIHHFDYGILLLLASANFLLFGSKRHSLIYLFTTAVASGLIIDDYFFIRRSVVEHPLIETQLYNATFPAVMVVVLVTILVVLFVQSIKKKKQ